MFDADFPAMFERRHLGSSGATCKVNPIQNICDMSWELGGNNGILKYTHTHIYIYIYAHNLDTLYIYIICIIYLFNGHITYNEWEYHNLESWLNRRH